MSSEEPAKLDAVDLLFLSADSPLADQLAGRLMTMQEVYNHWLSSRLESVSLSHRTPYITRQGPTSGMQLISDDPKVVAAFVASCPNPRDAALLRAISRRGGNR